MTRVVFITGGATGIGAASAREAARAGFAIAINYRSHERAAADLVDELRRGGARAMAIAGDVTNPEHVAGGFEAVEAELIDVSGGGFNIGA